MFHLPTDFKAKRRHTAAANRRRLLSFSVHGSVHGEKSYNYRRPFDCSNGFPVRLCETPPRSPELGYRVPDGIVHSQSQTVSLESINFRLLTSSFSTSLLS